MTEYTSKRYIDKKIRQVIVNENGKIINKRPSKDELKGLKEEKYKMHRNSLPQYTDEELLDYSRQFYEKYGKTPAYRDFINNPYYPGVMTYVRRFGSWENTLKLVKMDIDTRVTQEHLKTNKEKGRYTELMVRQMFNNKGTDLSGEKCDSHIDGICPNGMTYEVKSSGLRIDRDCFDFSTQNKDKSDYVEAIQWYYFVAMNRDYTKLMYIWRVPGEVAKKGHFIVGLKTSYEFNIENMKEYDITDRFKYVIMNGNNEMLKKTNQLI